MCTSRVNVFSSIYREIPILCTTPLYTPSRRRALSDTNLGPKFLKSRARKRFCEAISQLVLCRNMSNTKNFVLYLAANEMIVKSYVFHPRVEHQISAEISRADVITVDRWRCRDCDTQFKEERTDPS